MEIKTVKETIEVEETKVIKVKVPKVVEKKQFVLTEEEMLAIVFLAAPIKFGGINDLIKEGGDLFNVPKQNMGSKDFKGILVNLYCDIDKRALINSVLNK